MPAAPTGLPRTTGGFRTPGVAAESEDVRAGASREPVLSVPQQPPAVGHVGSGPPTYDAEPTALPPADPDALDDLVADTVLDGARYGTSTLRAVSVRGDSARYRGEPRRDALLTARFGAGEQALVLVAMATGARATPGAHRAAAEACRWIARAVGRSHDRLADDIRAARRGDLKSGLHRLTDRSLGKLRASAAEQGVEPEEYTASLRCLLLPADPECRTRVFFGVGAAWACSGCATASGRTSSRASPRPPGSPWSASARRRTRPRRATGSPWTWGSRHPRAPTSPRPAHHAPRSGSGPRSPARVTRSCSAPEAWRSPCAGSRSWPSTSRHGGRRGTARPRGLPRGQPGPGQGVRRRQDRGGRLGGVTAHGVNSWSRGTDDGTGDPGRLRASRITKRCVQHGQAERRRAVRRHPRPCGRQAAVRGRGRQPQPRRGRDPAQRGHRLDPRPARGDGRVRRGRRGADHRQAGGLHAAPAGRATST